MKLRDFLNMLDTMMPITLYYDCDTYGPYKTTEVPKRWLDRKIFQIFIEEEYDSIYIDVT